MSFFARVLNHLVNEVLVNSLANNRTFQQIAVRSNAWVADIAKKSALFSLRTSEFDAYDLTPLSVGTQRPLLQHMPAAGAEHQKKIGQQAQDFQKTFREEVSLPVTFPACSGS